MRTHLLVFSTLPFLVFSLACSTSGDTAGGGSSPSEAYRELYAAVKSKDTERIRSHMSERTVSFAGALSEKQKQPIEKVFENGFTATTYAETLPEIRDERIDGNNGAIEVWNAKGNLWEDLPFILENGRWKLAVGDVFARNWESPGRSAAQKEADAINATRPQPTPMMPMMNSNGAMPPFPVGNVNAPTNVNTAAVPKP
ncbi:MAG: hypothetical protein H0V76_05240 [Blastocatellia bacterium]|nr:hypothetical protein [Blastocatellia bacterium]